MSDVMIEANSLGKTYGTFVALRDASFKLNRGEILGLLGPNGAGKSTTMRILTCFLAPSTGSARIAGCDIWKDPIGVRRAVGYLPESTPLYTDMSVREYLEWAASMRQIQNPSRILDVVEQVGLEEVYGKTIGQLSKGYKQRVGLAQALVHEPPILILDEPLSGLDPNQASEIRDLIQKIGTERTIILSTHNLNEVQKSCQRVLIIDKGQIVADDETDALAAGEETRHVVTVLTKDPVTYHEGDMQGGEEKGLEGVFASLSNIHRVHQISATADEVKLELWSDSSKDERAAIFRHAVDNGLTLLELQTQTKNLEKVFRDLTQGDAAPSNEDSASQTATTAEEE